ncbi:MAG: decarboxylating NADP(+)-dependent phosphogluconate dehydrogenase [Spirochaetaceae bacterium]|nr:decarboxylating NADP(+)-dependent phosphogluconate dehydrogenase [Spirochaetaceae bacterium]
MEHVDIGLIGLGVMGENLLLNIESRGFSAAVYNRTHSKVDSFVQGRGKEKRIRAFYDPAAFTAALKRPRKVLIMVRAGQGVDDWIAQLAELLEPGDIIIDGGNSHYRDTIRRAAALEERGLGYIGAAFCGGEAGALTGPAIMVGGPAPSWSAVKPLFQAIAARAEDGAPCCDWVGENGAGHFVKMVHSGIEYGDMQLICEVYDIMRLLLGLSHEEMGDVFEEWNRGNLNSYLIEITRDILRVKDRDGIPLVEKILDTAGQKGMGKLAGITALEFGVPLTLIAEAVFSRCLSAAKEERLRSSRIFSGPRVERVRDRRTFLADLEKTLYAAKVVSYAQGYLLLRQGAREHRWNLDYGQIALLWRGGCVIRSAFLGKIKEAFEKRADLENLLLDPFFTRIIEDAQASWRRVVAEAVRNGIPTAALSSALAYFDGYRKERLPANLIQAQRDYFGAHSYERLDKSRGEFFHTNWTEGPIRP